MSNPRIDQSRKTEPTDSNANRMCMGCGWKGPIDNPFFVTSDVRRWKEEKFRLWRCPHCQSIHAMDTVNLERYYEGYPLHRRSLDFFARQSFGRLLTEMVARGLRTTDRILDFGCGKGSLINFFGEKGFSKASGFDPYSEGYCTPLPNDQQYDALCAIDVLEHVEDPLSSIKSWADLVRPGGLCVVSTPLSDRIDPDHPERFRHHLHQPFHRNLLSRRALIKMALEAGFRVEGIEERSMMDTRIPGVNWSFLETFFRESGDDTLDVGFEPVNFRRIGAFLKLVSPALFGYFWRDRVNGIFYLRRKCTTHLPPRDPHKKITSSSQEHHPAPLHS